MTLSPSGGIKRTVNFDMAKETHRQLYEFSKSLNLSEFVRSKLAEEMQKREQEGAQKVFR